MNPNDPDVDPKLVRQRLFRRATRQMGLAVMNAVVITMDDDPLPTDNNQAIGDITADTIRSLLTPAGVEKMIRVVHYVLGTHYSKPQ
jgi:hypothetical protein